MDILPCQVELYELNFHKKSNNFFLFTKNFVGVSLKLFNSATVLVPLSTKCCNKVCSAFWTCSNTLGNAPFLLLLGSFTILCDDMDLVGRSPGKSWHNFSIVAFTMYSNYIIFTLNISNILLIKRWLEICSVKIMKCLLHITNYWFSKKKTISKFYILKFCCTHKCACYVYL